MPESQPEKHQFPISIKKLFAVLSLMIRPGAFESKIEDIRMKRAYSMEEEMNELKQWIERVLGKRTNNMRILPDQRKKMMHVFLKEVETREGRKLTEAERGYIGFFVRTYFLGLKHDAFDSYNINWPEEKQP